MQENTVRKEETQEASKVVQLPVNEGDSQKVIDKAIDKLCELVPGAVMNYIRTGARSALTLKVTLQTNKNDEAEVTVDGTLTLASESEKMIGEVLDRQLRLW